MCFLTLAFVFKNFSILAALSDIEVKIWVAPLSELLGKMC